MLRFILIFTFVFIFVYSFMAFYTSAVEGSIFGFACTDPGAQELETLKKALNEIGDLWKKGGQQRFNLIRDPNQFLIGP